MGLEISIAAEPIFHIGELGITNSYITTLFVIFLFSILIIAFRSQPLHLIPHKHSLQNILEMIMELFLSFYTSIIGHHKARSYFAFLTTLFLFILISNWSGLLPGAGSIGIWEEHEGQRVLVPFLRAPTADLNTTIALALIGVIFVQYQGIKELKTKYLKKFFNFSNPILTFVGLLEIIGEGTRLVSFAFRLFGNIFAGEVLLAVMGFLLPFLAPLPFLGLEVFVGVVQSLVFVMLVMVFTAGATADHH